MAQTSPGVVLREQDFSDVAAQFSSAILGLVGTASRGPINQVVNISSVAELLDTFGPPTLSTVVHSATGLSWTKGLVAHGIQFLRYGGRLRVVRVANSATTASATFQASGSNSLTVQATSPGSWGSRIKIALADASIGGSANFDLSVYYDDVIVETYKNVWKDGGTGTSVPTEQNGATTNYVETRINGVSRYITVTDLGDSVDAPDPAAATALSSAVNGDTAMESSHFIGTAAGASGATGLQLLRDTDAVEINLIACPGVSVQMNSETSTYSKTRAVAQELIAIAEARGDCLAVLDAPHVAADPDGARNYANAVSPYNAGSAFSSSYAALYWSHIRHYAPELSQEVWSTPVGFVTGRMAFTDANAEPWFAAAGFGRGALRDALGLLYSPNLNQREDLYGPGQVVNPIVNFVGDGITVWGNKTTQRKLTALSSVHVRRMLCVAKRVINSAVKYLIFEQNDSRTQRRFRQIVNPVLASIKGRRGLTDFRVICDGTVNTPDIVDQNQMRAILLLKPTRAAEVITVNFTILSTGANFDEFIS